MKTAYFHAGNKLFPPLKQVVSAVETALRCRARKFLAPCRDISCSVLIWYLHGADIVSAPCRKGAPQHPFWTSG